MPLSVSTFLDRHPEFVDTNTGKPALVAAAVADANAEIDDDVWGASAARGQALHAANTVARSPFGMQAALVDKETNKPIYEPELDRLRMLVGGANRPVMP